MAKQKKSTAATTDPVTPTDAATAGKSAPATKDKSGAVKRATAKPAVKQSAKRAAAPQPADSKAPASTAPTRTSSKKDAGVKKTADSNKSRAKSDTGTRKVRPTETIGPRPGASSIRMSKKLSDTEPSFDKDTPGCVLGNEATILRAPLFKGDNSKVADAFKVASIKDIQDYGYLESVQKEIRLKAGAERAQKYVLEPFDVLLTIVGTIGEVTIVPEKLDGTWIPTSNMLVIRFKDEDREEKHAKAIAFYMFVKSPKGQELLERLRHGKTIKIISKKAFTKTVIPALTPAIRKVTKALFAKETALYQKRAALVDEAKALRATYLVP